MKSVDACVDALKRYLDNIPDRIKLKYKDLSDQEKEFFARYSIRKENANAILKDLNELPGKETDFFKDPIRGKLRADFRDLIQDFRNNRFTQKRINGFEDFSEFFVWCVDQRDKQDGKCFYCGVDEVTSVRFLTGVSKKFNGRFQLERLDPDGGYNKDNCVLVCVLCNNAKSDMISHNDFKYVIAPSITAYWNVLKKRELEE